MWDTVPSDIKTLEDERKRLYRELSGIGDFRRGSIAKNYRRCGKSNCVCMNPGHPGHGPQYLLTSKVSRKTKTKVIKPGPELSKTEQEISNHSHFQELTRRIIDINELICDIRPVPGSTETAKKGASKTGSKRKSPKNSTSS